MDLIEFTEKASHAANGPIERWAEHMQIAVTDYTLQLARYIELLPRDLRHDYVELVQRVLETIPKDQKVRVAPSVLERLQNAFPPTQRDVLRQKLSLPLED